VTCTVWVPANSKSAFERDTDRVIGNVGCRRRKRVCPAADGGQVVAVGRLARKGKGGFEVCLTGKGTQGFAEDEINGFAGGIEGVGSIDQVGGSGQQHRRGLVRRRHSGSHRLFAAERIEGEGAVLRQVGGFDPVGGTGCVRDADLVHQPVEAAVTGSR